MSWYGGYHSLNLNIEGYKLFCIVYYMSQHKSGVLLGRTKMEANRTYTNETGVSSR